MVLVKSTMLDLGTTAPAFSLKDVVTGKEYSNTSLDSKKLMLVIFMCKHCPYITHIQDELAKFGRDYENSELGIIGISSNDPQGYPEDSPEKLKEFAQKMDFRFPLLFDDTQEVAKSYTAACTPDFFLFDKNRKLVYRGQFDDSRRGNSEPISGKDLRKAVDLALKDQPISADQKPSSGCNIKWRERNEPSYFGVQ